MKKFLIKYTIILLGNLLAFLSIGYILDSIFKTNGKFVIFCLIISIFTLVFFTQFLLSKGLKELKNIKNNNNKNERD